MKNWKKLLVLAVLLVGVVGCGKVPTLKNGEQAVATLDKNGVSAESLYKALKDKYGPEIFVNLLDTEIFNNMYKKESDEEKDYIKSQIEELENSAKQNKVSFEELIAYYGFESKKDIEEYLKLTHRRETAVKDAIEKEIKDKEIDTYYKEEIYGDIKLKHILIAPDTTDEMTAEEKEKAEKEAKKTATDIIAKLKKGENFDKLAKKHSDDTSNASKGGDLGWVSTGDMVKEFDAAAFALKKGKYTTSPVKTTYGYHIIYKVDEKSKPKLKEVKEEILESLVNEKLEKDPTLYYETLEQIREDAGLKFKDKDLKTAYNKYITNLKNQAKQQAESASTAN